MLTAISNEKSRPDYKGSAHQRQADALRVVQDVFAGTKRLRDAGETYLPKFPLETPQSYGGRRSAAVLYNAFKHTARGLVGMLFRKDLRLEDDVPDPIAGAPVEEGGKREGGHVENIDLAGRHLGVFARDLAEVAWRDGHALIFVDWSGPPQSTLADERAAGARPYWSLYEKGQLYSFRTQRVGDGVIVTQVALGETAVVEDAEFGERRSSASASTGSRAVRSSGRYMRSGRRGCGGASTSS